MHTISEVYVIHEIRLRREQLEKLDRENARYDQPLVEQHRRAAQLIERLRRAWMPAAPVAPSERETREQPVICLHC
jgi:hypothetical protein